MQSQLRCNMIVKTCTVENHEIYLRLNGVVTGTKSQKTYLILTRGARLILFNPRPSLAIVRQSSVYAIAVDWGGKSGVY